MSNAFVVRNQETGNHSARRGCLDPMGQWVGTLAIEGESSEEALPLKILRRVPNGPLVALWGDRIIQGTITKCEGQTWFHVDGKLYELTLKPEAVDAMEQEASKAHVATGSIAINSPIPGLVKSIPVKVGDEVEAGQTILILEAMKMENEIPAPHAGKIESISIQEEESVAAGALLLKLFV